ncbi:hypothetical protein [Sphingomonas sp. LT1P40]|uniref:hypothetical protein n=1 Tax=Alteristakelama amylovorans TaxID=3096166 RepID=UPI002FCB3464
MSQLAIAAVEMDGEGRLFVRPASGDFEHIYRAAMEVYWDRSSKRLFHPHAPRDWTSADWFRQIVAAVASEYGVQLQLMSNTIWVDVPAGARSEIEADQPIESS